MWMLTVERSTVTSRRLGLNCVQKPANGACVVFAHGVLSDGESAWGLPPWPELLAGDPTLQGVGVYSYTYFTRVGSGSYSIGEAADMLHELFDLEGLWEIPSLVLIGHSMGGIVFRRFLVANEARLREAGTRIGLVLVASPSQGSWLATRLRLLLWAAGHSQAFDLSDSTLNTWLSGLDGDFQALVPRLDIRGRELLEGMPIPMLRWFGVFRRIVEPRSGGRYFPYPVTIPLTDHWTIAKPQGRDEIQYRIVSRFVSQHFGAWPGHLEPIGDGSSLRVDQAMKGLSAKIASIAPWRDAIVALQDALLETRLYVARRREGGERDKDVEERLSRVWSDVSARLMPHDIELAMLCGLKGQAWADPALLDNVAFRELPTELDDITARLILLLSTGKPPKADAELRRAILAIRNNLERFELVRDFDQGNVGARRQPTSVFHRLSNDGTAVEFVSPYETASVSIEDLQNRLTAEERRAVAASEESMRKLAFSWEEIVLKGLLDEEDERKLKTIARQMAQQLDVVFKIVAIRTGGYLQDHYAQQRAIADKYRKEAAGEMRAR